MSNSSGSDLEVVEVLELRVREEESVEPSMSEWSSLELSVREENPKRVLFDQGLYDPGSGEVCAAYVCLSDSAVFRHVYYNYPSVKDPGISHALFGPPPHPVYPDDGQELYLAICKEMNQCPVRPFYRALLEKKAALSYYGVNPYGIRAMAKSLVNNKTLTSIDLTENFLNDDACFHLGEMLTTNSVLTELNLCGCRIGESGALRLCAGLPSNGTLKALDLSRNQLGDEGGNHFAEAVYFGSDVQNINLSNNNISGKCAQTLAEALEFNNKITHINLSHNLLFSFPSGLAKLLNELGNSELLKYVNLSWNSLTGTKASGAIKDLFRAKILEHLDISNNKLSTTEVVMHLIGSMAKPKKMVIYNVSFNPISVEDALLFINKLNSKAVKIQALNMDGINVNVQFTELLKTMKQLTYKESVVVTHGHIEGTYIATGPDPRETALNRAEFVCKKPKRRKIDIALVVYQLVKDGKEVIDLKEFGEAVKLAGIVLDEGLIAELQSVFPGASSKKGAKKINVAKMAEYMKRKWPERHLPPTPPPEPEPEPVPKGKGKGKKGGKAKAKKK